MERCRWCSHPTHIGRCEYPLEGTYADGTPRTCGHSTVLDERAAELIKPRSN